MTVKELIAHASQCTGITTAAIYGPSQQAHLSAVRCALYIVARDDLKMSWPAIGRRFARHHTTVIPGYRAYETHLKRFPDMPVLVDALRTGQVVACRFPASDEAVKARKPRRFWTQEEVEYVEGLMELGLTRARIGELIGRCPDSIRRVRRSGRFVTKPVKPPTNLRRAKVHHPANLRQAESFGYELHHTGV